MSLEEYRKEFLAEPQPMGELMIESIRFCLMSEAFGTQVLIFSWLGEE